MKNSEEKYLEVLKELKTRLEAGEKLKAIHFSREKSMNANLFNILIKLGYLEIQGSKRLSEYNWIGAKPTLRAAKRVLKEQRGYFKNRQTTPIIRKTVARVSSNDIKYIETKILFGLFKIKSTIVR